MSGSVKRPANHIRRFTKNRQDRSRLRSELRQAAHRCRLPYFRALTRYTKHFTTPRNPRLSHDPPARKRIRTGKCPSPALPDPIVAPVISSLQPGALAAFFERYLVHDFVYDPTAVPTLEYERLKEHLGIFHPDDPRRTPTRNASRKAIVAEFGIQFGWRTNDLQVWQKLCKRIGIYPVPATLEDARSKFRETHVNIVELMTSGISDGKMKKFKTEDELAEYTRDHEGLTFPREFVQRGSILWYLLRLIWNKP